MRQQRMGNRHNFGGRARPAVWAAHTGNAPPGARVANDHSRRAYVRRVLAPAVLPGDRRPAGLEADLPLLR